MKVFIKIVLLLVVVVVFSFTTDFNATSLSPEQMKADMTALKAGLEKYHPGLYWYTSKAEFAKSWDSLKEILDKPMTDEQFFRLLLPVIAKVKCAHTLFYPNEDVISGGTRFPLDLKFIGGKGYIITDSAEVGIKKGPELLSINGKGLEEIVNTMLPVLEAQGGNIVWKYVILENDFQNYYYYVFGQQDQFKVEFKNPLKGDTTVVIGGSASARLRHHWKNWYPASNGRPLKVSFDFDRNAAILTIKSFSGFRYKLYNQDFESDLDKAFSEFRMKGIKHLIIDVRGDEGGNKPEKLFSYIDLTGKQPNSFRGDVTVLTGDRSISAMETFVSIFRNHRRGVTVGGPTPGCAVYLCGGNKHHLVLPNSKFTLDIPLHPSLRTNPSGVKYAMGEGYQPDYRVEKTIPAFLAGRDPVMDYALNLIQ